MSGRWKLAALVMSACTDPEQSPTGTLPETLTTTDASGTPWTPTFVGTAEVRYGPSRSGVSSGPTPGGFGAERWSIPVENLGAGFVATSDTVFVSDANGIVALDAATGQPRWTAALSYPGPVSVGAGILCVQSADDFVYAFDAATGTLLWSTETGYSTERVALIVDDHVYVGGFGNVLALELQTGALLWEYADSARWDQFDGSPVQIGPVSWDNGMVYFVTIGAECVNAQCDHRPYYSVYALDAASGALAWKDEVKSWEGPVHPVPVSGGYVVYPPMDEVVPGRTNPGNWRLRVLDALTGDEVWERTYEEEGFYASIPAVSNGVLVLGTTEFDDDSVVDFLQGIDLATGVTTWTGSRSAPAPTFIGDALLIQTQLVAESASILRLLDTTGHPLDQRRLDATFDLSPVAVGESVYVMLDDATLRAIALVPEPGGTGEDTADTGVPPDVTETVDSDVTDTGVAIADSEVLIENFNDGTQFGMVDGMGIPTSFFSDGADDYFGISDGSAGGDFGGETPPDVSADYTGLSGSALVVQDLDARGLVLPVTLTWSDLDIVGLSDLEVHVTLAEALASDGYNDIDVDDYLFIEVVVDGAPPVEVAAVRGDQIFNGVFRVDTDGDGLGDGLDPIGPTAAEWVFSIPATGSAMDLHLVVSVNGSDEDLAIDTLRVVGVAPM